MKTGANKREHRKPFVTPKLTLYGTLEEITMQTQPGGQKYNLNATWAGDGNNLNSGSALNIDGE
jgi:hypothetical protein